MDKKTFVLLSCLTTGIISLILGFNVLLTHIPVALPVNILKDGSSLVISPTPASATPTIIFLPNNTIVQIHKKLPSSGEPTPSDVHKATETSPPSPSPAVMSAATNSANLRIPSMVQTSGGCLITDDASSCVVDTTHK